MAAMAVQVNSTSECEDGTMFNQASAAQGAGCAACPIAERCVDGECVVGSTGGGCATCLLEPEKFYQSGTSVR